MTNRFLLRSDRMVLRCVTLALAWLICLAASSPTSFANASTPGILPARSSHDHSGSVQADIWIISTRQLACPHHRTGIADELTFYRLRSCQRVRSSSAEFLATLDPSMGVCVFVHGNRMEADEVPQQAHDIRRRLDCAHFGCRLVFWSWPSDRIPGPLRDARSKASRADGEAFYLASFLAGLPDSTQVNLIGYSFGARAVTGGLHLLAGGALCGNRLCIDQPSQLHPMVLLFAAAVPNHWLRPHHQHGLALSQASQVLSFFNPRDPALARFPLALRTGGADALGYLGISTRCLGPIGWKLRQCDVSGSVGRTHDLYKYLDCGGIMGKARRMAGQHVTRVE